MGEIGAMDTERNLIECIRQGSVDFPDALDAFVGQLLTEVGYAPRPTDGVILSRQVVESGRARGVGVVVMVEDQRVEPLRFDFAIDTSGRSIQSGVVCFGDSESIGPRYSGPEHHRMVRLMLASEDVELSWIERFVRDPGGWRRE